jgi:hypothetical protein
MEAKEYIDLRKSLEVEEAKQVLRRRGYFVDGLWTDLNIMVNYECTNEQAQKILAEALLSDEVIMRTWHSIDEAAQKMNIKSK